VGAWIELEEEEVSSDQSSITMTIANSGHVSWEHSTRCEETIVVSAKQSVSS
jgi:hypothetical protein